MVVGRWRRTQRHLAFTTASCHLNFLHYSFASWHTCYDSPCACFFENRLALIHYPKFKLALKGRHHGVTTAMPVESVASPRPDRRSYSDHPLIIHPKKACRKKRFERKKNQHERGVLVPRASQEGSERSWIRLPSSSPLVLASTVHAQPPRLFHPYHPLPPASLAMSTSAGFEWVPIASSPALDDLAYHRPPASPIPSATHLSTARPPSGACPRRPRRERPLYIFPPHP